MRPDSHDMETAKLDPTKVADMYRYLTATRPVPSFA